MGQIWIKHSADSSENRCLRMCRAVFWLSDLSNEEKSMQ